MIKESKDKEYISLREASRQTNYSQGYLAFLIRRGKLKANRIGKIWVTKKEWLKECFKKIKR